MSNKLYLFFTAALFTVLMSCKTSQSNRSATSHAGMFKVAILYPAGEDKTFNMAYYENKHMPMVAAYLGKNLKFYEIDKGLTGRTPNDKAPFVAIGYFYISDIAAYHSAIAQHREAIIGDIKNYTNIQPVVQITEVVQVGYGNSNKE